MKCANHPEADATGYCRNCGKPMCALCVRNVQGVLYCEPCLAAMLAAPQAAAASGSPGLAAVLGFIPGLGAVYNGEYLKALIHIAIFAGLIVLLNSDQTDPYEVLYSLLLAGFILYMPIEAYRTARAKKFGAAAGVTAAPAISAAGGNPSAGVTEETSKSANWLTGPAVLIGIGVLLLLMNLGWLRAYWMHRFWPLLLIVLGAWLLWRRLEGT